MPKESYNKLPISYQDQLQQLKDRGLVVENEEHFLHLLEVKSYYRLSAYWFPLLKDKDLHLFKEGASFSTAYKIYSFDREFRHLVLAELEKIEVAIRAKIIYIMSHKHGAFWFQNRYLFYSEIKHKRLLEKLNTEYQRSDEEFILSFKKKYDNPLPPCWMLFEVTSFGSLSQAYSNLKPGIEKREIAKTFGLSDKVLSSWLHSIVYFRNVCAHHSRLWNRVMSIQPIIPRKTSDQWLETKVGDNNSTYYLLSMLVYLMNTIKQENDVIVRVKELFEKYPNIDPKAMGFPENWKDEPLWK
jgi:abortive infection bacteriophage resistance protein